VLPQKNGNI